jgi:hypothetical protein
VAVWPTNCCDGIAFGDGGTFEEGPEDFQAQVQTRFSIARNAAYHSTRGLNLAKLLGQSAD